MPEITKADTADVLAQLPELVPWNPKTFDRHGIDLLVCCAGFEERSTALVSDLAAGAIKTPLIIRYATNAGDNAKALETFRNMWPADGRCEISYQGPSFLSNLRTMLTKARNAPGLRVLVDLSGMASFIIYRVLTAIWEELPQARVSVCYAEAADYAPSHDEWDVFYSSVDTPEDNLAIAEHYERVHFQSKGVDITFESDVFPGENVGPLATELVAIPSFSLQRMKSMLTYAESRYNVQDNGVHWFLGQPPDRVRNAWRFDALAALYNVRERGIGVSTRDYKDILHRLDQLWEDIHTERHLLIANLGSKMQHLGCFLFLRMHRECGLILCEPEEFIATRYSTGVGPRWFLDLGLVRDVSKVLELRGKLRFHW